MKVGHFSYTVRKVKEFGFKPHHIEFLIGSSLENVDEDTINTWCSLEDVAKLFPTIKKGDEKHES